MMVQAHSLAKMLTYTFVKSEDVMYLQLHICARLKQTFSSEITKYPTAYNQLKEFFTSVYN